MERRLAAVLLCCAAFLVLPAPAFAATATVTIGSTLSPKSLTVAPGTTVTWRNADAERHRVRTTSAPVELDSNDLDPGESWSFTFRTAGTYRYADHREEDDSAYWGTVTVTVTSSAPAPTSPPSGGGSTTPTAPVSATVGMAGRAFSPSSVQVRAGGTVTFANTDDRAHTVTANDGSFDSGVVNAGGRWTRAFPSAGTFRYFCAIHPDMTGTVTVPTSTGSVPPPAAPAPRPAAPAPVAPPAAAPPGGGSVPASIRVNVVDFAFTPARATARVGDTVTWANAGTAPHTVTANGAPFGTSMLAAGASYRWSPTRTGTWSYVCAFHPQMTGTLVVLPRSAAPPAAAPGLAPSPASTSGSGDPADPADPANPDPATGAPPSGPTTPGSSVPGSSRPGSSVRTLRPVRSASPMVTWTVWGGLGIVAFLTLAWWRGREVPRG